jgi:hypothetical protein
VCTFVPFVSSTLSGHDKMEISARIFSVMGYRFLGATMENLSPLCALIVDLLSVFT